VRGRCGGESAWGREGGYRGDCQVGAGNSPGGGLDGGGGHEIISGDGDSRDHGAAGKALLERSIGPHKAEGVTHKGGAEVHADRVSEGPS